jgi:hypothetical protein
MRANIESELRVFVAPPENLLSPVKKLTQTKTSAFTDFSTQRQQPFWHLEKKNLELQKTFTLYLHPQQRKIMFNPTMHMCCCMCSTEGRDGRYLCM